MAFGVVAAAAVDRLTLYTGNDDHIIADLVTPMRIRTPGREVVLRFKGGLLGHWSIWTKCAVALLAKVQAGAGRGVVSDDLLATDAMVTDCNSVIFDVANGFAGCIPGCHEVLRRQGLMRSVHCLAARCSVPDKRRASIASPPSTRSSTTTPSCAPISHAGAAEAARPMRVLAPGRPQAPPPGGRRLLRCGFVPA